MKTGAQWLICVLAIAITITPLHSREQQAMAMATATAAAHNRWAALDDALESSDQSFAGLRRVASAGAARRQRPPLASAFFFETTDEDEVGGASSSSRVAERALVAAPAAQPLPPRLHIGEVRFPTTRSVLWCVQTRVCGGVTLVATDVGVCDPCCACVWLKGTVARSPIRSASLWST